MRDLRWSDVSEWFDPDDGALHDGCVIGVVPGAWQAVADLVKARVRSTREGEGALLVSPAEGFFVNFFEVFDEVAFDVHVGELQGQQRLSAFLREWGAGPVETGRAGVRGFVLDRR